MGATSRDFTEKEREQLFAVQRQANRWTYLGTGMTHPNFKASLQAISPEAARTIEQVAPAFC